MNDNFSEEAQAIEIVQNEVMAISANPFHAMPTGLIVTDENVPFDLWSTYGEALQRVEAAIQWVIGDWLNYGEEKYGEDYAAALPDTDRGYESLGQCKWVAKAVEPSTRVQELSWSHHREVAKLEPESQKFWLDLAVEYDWSVRELRDAIRDANKPEELEEPPGQGESENWEERALLAEARLDALLGACRSCVAILRQREDDQSITVVQALQTAIDQLGDVPGFV